MDMVHTDHLSCLFKLWQPPRNAMKKKQPGRSNIWLWWCCAAAIVVQHNSCGAAQITARVTTLAASQFRFTASHQVSPAAAFPPKLPLITCCYCCLSRKTRHLLFSNLTILFIFSPGFHNGPYLAVAR